MPEKKTKEETYSASQRRELLRGYWDLSLTLEPYMANAIRAFKEGDMTDYEERSRPLTTKEWRKIDDFFLPFDRRHRDVYEEAI